MVFHLDDEVDRKKIEESIKEIVRTQQLVQNEREELSVMKKNAQFIQIFNTQNETIKSKKGEICLLRKILADNRIEV